MPNYEYRCDYCAYNFQVTESIKADPQTSCVQCGQEQLHRVIHAAHVFCKDDPTTIGHLADINTAKMGRYELEAKRHEHAEVARRKKPKAERPFWRKTDKVDTSLATMAPNVVIKDGKIVKSDPLSQKAMDFIMTGKK